MANVLATLTVAGILQRNPALRVHPRFLAHAEDTARRHGAGGDSALRLALSSWQDRVDVDAAARVVGDLMTDRHQWGALAPVFSAVDRI